MKTLANIIWFLLGGLILGTLWLCFGLVLCLTVVGIPLGKQCFKAAKLTVMPFGRKVRTRFGKHPIANTVWMFLLGWEMATGFFLAGLLCCITVVGIPVGLQAFKMTRLALFPFGAKVK